MWASALRVRQEKKLFANYTKVNIHGAGAHPVLADRDRVHLLALVGRRDGVASGRMVLRGPKERFDDERVCVHVSR